MLWQPAEVWEGRVPFILTSRTLVGVLKLPTVAESVPCLQTFSGRVRWRENDIRDGKNIKRKKLCVHLIHTTGDLMR